MGSNHGKHSSQKSRDTLPLSPLWFLEKVTLKDVLNAITDKHIVDVTKYIKLPDGISILYSDYMKLIDGKKMFRIYIRQIIKNIQFIADEK